MHGMPKAIGGQLCGVGSLEPRPPGLCGKCLYLMDLLAGLVLIF